MILIGRSTSIVITGYFLGEAAENEVQKRQAQREAEKLKEEQEELNRQLQEKTVRRIYAL